MIFPSVSTILYVVSALPTILLLSKVMRISSGEAKLSRRYYSLCLISVLIWTGLAVVIRNVTPDFRVVAEAVTRLTFVVVSLAIFFFVMSSIYFARSPRDSEAVFVASPIVVALIANLVDPFTVSWRWYGWSGDFSNPLIRYSWLALINLVMVYSFVRVYQIRSKIRSDQLRKRLAFFLAGALIALVTGVFLYLITQVVELPGLSAIAVNFSLLVGYPAFSTKK